MDINNTDEQEVLETPETEVDEEETTEEEDESSSEEESEVDERDQKIAELERKNKQLFERVKKQPAQSDLSQNDLIAIMKADVHEEDITEVTDYAKLKGLSVKEALNSSVVKAILSERKEERTSAGATNTSGSKKAPAKVSSDRLLSDAREGKMPESDQDIQRLLDAQIELKRNKRK